MPLTRLRFAKAGLTHPAPEPCSPRPNHATSTAVVKGGTAERRPARFARAATAALIATTTLTTPATAEPLTLAQRRALSASGLPASAVVSAKPDLVVAVRSRGTARADGIIEGVELQGEVVSSAAAQTRGYRSMRSTVNIDCARRRDQVVRMTIYPEAGAKGAPITRQVPEGWVQPSPAAYLSDVMGALCASVPRAAVTKAAAPKSERWEIPLRALGEAPRRAAAPPAPTILSASAIAPAALADPDLPLPTSLDARIGRAPAAEEAAVEASAPPAPAPAPRAARAAVQIAAAASERQAREALAKVKGRVAPPLATEVQVVSVEGKTFHRALVSGFATRAEAQAFCAALGSACFVR